ncbi:hypothetical protein FIU82_05940 [Pseudoalteromonas sp. THAF3]|uniref:hypothetical protein n=1 Tax=Pseudoalteromonas sp. THAF3 TaxID=2587843 RepID=UPI0012A94B1B|nr:hypothetical protein FIU82_05940 [Pseudoalteromonas sp. THAF3]
MAKAKNPKYTSPRAIASYPYLNKPDEFKGACRFKADLVMDRDVAAPLIEKCEDALKAFVEKHNEQVADGSKKGKKLNLKKALATGLPFDEHEEDEDKVVFKVKQNAVVNGDKVRLVYYDAKGTRIKKAPIIRGGSTIKVSGTIRGYEGFGGGVTLSISAVQIIDLSEGGADLEDGSAFGFEEEDGFEADAYEEGFEEDEDGSFDADDAPDDEDDDDEDF